MQSGTKRGYQTQDRTAIALPEAQRALLRHVRPIDKAKVRLEQAFGYRLAAAAYASEPIPHFRRSGMDGYAVRTEDLAELPVTLEVTQRIACGTPPAGALGAGTAARIMTGGMVPDGADAVIMQEMAEETADGQRCYVRFTKAVPSGTNITPVGLEAGRGEKLLDAGERIGPAQAALLAAIGCDEPSVYRKPIVAIICTGDELLAIHQRLQPGKIRNSNLYMLASQIREYGGEPQLIGSIPDEPQEARRMLYGIMEGEADLVLTTGGVSVGDFDVVAAILADWDGDTLFNKITMRPGSPTSAGVRGGKLLIGLSGNPAACLAGCELLVRPVLRQMQGERAITADEHGQQAILAEGYGKVNAYTRYIRGIRYTDGATVYVRQAGADRSSAIVSLKEANCLIVIPPTKTGVLAGELVTIIPL